MRMRRLLRSLSALALSSEALKNLPGRYEIAVTSPAAGLRFTWQLKTLMKTLTRVRGMSAIPSSAGGTAGSISETMPSAGLTTSPGRSGVTRSGSRKK